MQPEEMILSWFADQFLVDGNGDQLTVREPGRWTWSLQGVLNHR
ncbi:MAG: hypothetical protein ACJ797_27270 [Ktedonobacteraceae bacterium]